MSPLAISIQERPTSLVVHLAGDAGISELDGLRRTVDDLTQRPARRVIVDLSHLNFIASLGLGQLVRLAVAVRNRGGLFRICGASPSVTQAIIKSKLNELMPVFRDLADAER